MVVSGGLDSSSESISGVDPKNKKRISNIFGRDQVPPVGSAKPKLSMFASPKPKDRKKAVLTLTQVTQAFAVYPERPELIPRSSLMKIEGLMGDEQAAGGMRCREGWWLVMPDIEPGVNMSPELLRWVVGSCRSSPASPVFGFSDPLSPKPYTTFLDFMVDLSRTLGILVIPPL